MLKTIYYTGAKCAVAITVAAGAMVYATPCQALAQEEVGLSEESIILPGYVQLFPDVDQGSWYANDVNRAAELGLLMGYDDTFLFGPNDNMTRGQMMVVLKRLFDSANFEGTPYWGQHKSELKHDFPSYNATSFTDVPNDAYYTEAINWAAHYNIVSGYAGTNEFGPNDPITREQCAAMVSSWLAFYQYDPGAVPVDWDRSSEIFDAYSDASSVDEWARMSVLNMLWDGCMTGVPQDEGLPQFQPKRSLLRCEAAKVIVAAYGKTA